MKAKNKAEKKTKKNGWVARKAAESLRDDSIPEEELETDHLAYLSEPGWNGPGRSARSPESQREMEETWDRICG
jgi:hypothetical protein